MCVLLSGNTRSFGQPIAAKCVRADKRPFAFGVAQANPYFSLGNRVRWIHRREMIGYCAQVKLAFGPAENTELKIWLVARLGGGDPPNPLHFFHTGHRVSSRPGTVDLAFEAIDHRFDPHVPQWRTVDAGVALVCVRTDC